MSKLAKPETWVDIKLCTVHKFLPLRFVREADVDGFDGLVVDHVVEVALVVAVVVVVVVVVLVLYIDEEELLLVTDLGPFSFMPASTKLLFSEAVEAAASIFSTSLLLLSNDVPLSLLLSETGPNIISQIEGVLLRALFSYQVREIQKCIHIKNYWNSTGQ